MAPKDVPNEVLQQIFQLLPRQTVHQCLFVCKACALKNFTWKSLSPMTKLKLVQALLQHEDDSLPKTITNGELVKGIKVVDIPARTKLTQAQFTQEHLHSFLQCLPHLKRIDLTFANVNWYKYLEHLENILKSSDNDNGVVARLEDISTTAINNKAMSQYFKVCYAIKGRLKSLVVRYMMERFRVHDQQVGYPLEFTSHFKNLTRLEICNNGSASDGIGDITTHTLHSIFAACPNLTHFILDTAYLDLETANTTSSDPISPNLKALFLHVPRISVRHLLNYFKALGLDRLNATADAYEVWVQDCDKNELANLIDKLRATHQVKINMMTLNSSRQSKTPKLLNFIKAMSREERMNAFVSVITSLCKQRKLICELRLEIQNTSWDLYAFN